MKLDDTHYLNVCLIRQRYFARRQKAEMRGDEIRVLSRWEHCCAGSWLLRLSK